MLMNLWSRGNSAIIVFEEFLPFIHRLLTRGYPNIVKECSIQGRLSLLLLNDQTISYNKFKKARNIQK
jgi:hypothetical protein